MMALSPSDWLVAHGLEAPLLPEPLARDLHELRDGLYATRDDVGEPHELRPFLEEAAAAERPDCLLLGDSGHGPTGWALHFFAIQGPVAVFVQIQWGGAYGEQDEDAGAFAHAVRTAVELLAAGRGSRLDPRARLIACRSSFAGDGWLALDAPVEPAALARAPWRETPYALEEATAFLRSR